VSGAAPAAGRCGGPLSESTAIAPAPCRRIRNGLLPSHRQSPRLKFNPGTGAVHPRSANTRGLQGTVTGVHSTSRQGEEGRVALLTARGEVHLLDGGAAQHPVHTRLVYLQLPASALVPHTTAFSWQSVCPCADGRGGCGCSKTTRSTWSGRQDSLEPKSLRSTACRPSSRHRDELLLKGGSDIRARCPELNCGGGKDSGVGSQSGICMLLHARE
jgi:hypothetical protein